MNHNTGHWYRQFAPWARLRHLLKHPRGLFPGAPRGIINSIQEWVQIQQRQVPVDIRPGASCQYWAWDAPEILQLPPPRSPIADQPTPPIQRLLSTDETALIYLRGARVLGREGTVISSDNRVFAEFSYVDSPGGISSHDVFRRRRFPTAEFLRGWYATLCYPSAFAYFHWVIESLPRLRFLEDYLDALDGVFVPRQIEPAVRDSLLAFGLRPEQLITLEMESHFEPEHLLVPRYCAGLNIPPWVPAYLREKSAPGLASSAATERVYISRGDATRRRVVNEEALRPVLEKHGFRIYNLRELAFSAQTALFQQAAVVVGAHGAGLVNSAFCQPGFQLLELLPTPDVPPHLYYSLTSAAGGSYWYLQGSPVDDGEALPPVHRSFSIQPEVLDTALSTIIAHLNEPTAPAC